MIDPSEDDFMILYTLADRPYTSTLAWSTAKDFVLDPILNPADRDHEFLPNQLYQNSRS